MQGVWLEKQPAKEELQPQKLLAQSAANTWKDM